MIVVVVAATVVVSADMVVLTLLPLLSLVLSMSASLNFDCCNKYALRVNISKLYVVLSASASR